MNVRVNQKYITVIRSSIITNQYIIAVISLLEYYPMFLYVLLSSYYFSYEHIPSFFHSIYHKLSYVDLFKEMYNNNYPYPYLIAIIVLYIIFIAYKYLLLDVFNVNNKIINFIVVNIYESFVFRALTFNLFDIEIKFILSSSSPVVSCLCILLLCLHKRKKSMKNERGEKKKDNQCEVLSSRKDKKGLL